MLYHMVSFEVGKRFEFAFFVYMPCEGTWFESSVSGLSAAAFMLQQSSKAEHYIYNVTLPSEMSHSATRSLLGYNHFLKGGAIISILAFQLNQFLQSFLHQKNTLVKCYTH